MGTNKNGTKWKVVKLLAMLLIAGLIVSSLAPSVSAKEYGEKIGEHSDVIAKSNGICTAKYSMVCEGEYCVDCSVSENRYWQCVEYVDRFYEEAMGIPGASNWLGHGYQYYSGASVKGLTSYANSGSMPPHSCDLLCFNDGGYGHVAIVMGTDDNYVYIIEQNWQRNTAYKSLSWDKDTNTIYDRGAYRVQGWLRKDTWNFNTSNNAEGWTAVNAEEYSVEDGKYFINPEQTDPYIKSASLSLNADNYTAIEINMASNCLDGNARIYFTTADSPDYSEDKRVSFEANNDGGWHTYTVYMAGNLWKGATITGIRIDPADTGEEKATDTDTIGFDWIKAVKIEHPRYDINEDGVVNILDTVTWKQCYYYDIPCKRCDCDEDGDIDVVDWAILASHYGEKIPTV
ncbi:MAG: CHAP domain-containing protein [Bacteroidota bacterium]|nr:CHAP domain-containing protein [Bacteroidota bacterium]